MDIESIQIAIKKNRVRFSSHAKTEMMNDKFDVDDVLNSVSENGEIIEDYPEDRISPSCLIYGHAYDNRPIHSVWGYNRESKVAICITVYEPDQSKWIKNRIRVSNQ